MQRIALHHFARITMSTLMAINSAAFLRAEGRVKPPVLSRMSKQSRSRSVDALRPASSTDDRDSAPDPHARQR